MGGLKYYERTKVLIELIEKEKTGSPRELAGKLGLKERMIYNLLDDLGLALGKDVCYCKEKKSYIFPIKLD
jgi:transcriptional antiterminator